MTLVAIPVLVIVYILTHIFAVLIIRAARVNRFTIDEPDLALVYLLLVGALLIAIGLRTFFVGDLGSNATVLAAVHLFLLLDSENVHLFD